MNTMQRPWPDLEKGTFDPELGTLFIRPPLTSQNEFEQLHLYFTLTSMFIAKKTSDDLPLTSELD